MGERGYHEIQAPRVRYRIIDRAALAAAVGLADVTQLAPAHREWLAAALRTDPQERRLEWTQSVAVGSRAFVERVGAALGVRTAYRTIQATGDGFTLRESGPSYGAHFGARNAHLKPGNALCFGRNIRVVMDLQRSDPREVPVSSAPAAAAAALHVRAPGVRLRAPVGLR